MLKPSKSLVKITIYTQSKDSTTKIFENLKKNIKKFSFTRLPCKHRNIVICPSVSGRGYSTFRKYRCTLRKAICVLSNIKDIQNAIKSISLEGVFFETIVQ